MRLVTFALLVDFRLELDDDPLDFFAEDPLLERPLAERPPLDDLREDVLPPDAVFDLPPDEEAFDLPRVEELLPLLFEPPELFDEPDRLPAPDDLDDPLDLRPEGEDEDDDFDLPDEPNDRPPALDLDRLPPPLVVRDEDPLPLLEVAIFSAAAPTAPTAAPAAAPLIICPATSMTLSTIPDDELLGLDDLPRAEVDDELLFCEPPDLDLFGILSSQFDRNKNNFL